MRWWRWWYTFLSTIFRNFRGSGSTGEIMSVSLLSAVISEVKQPNRWVIRRLKNCPCSTNEYRSRKRVPDSRHMTKITPAIILSCYTVDKRVWYGEDMVLAYFDRSKCCFNVWKINSRCSPSSGERAGAVRLRQQRRSLSLKLLLYTWTWLPTAVRPTSQTARVIRILPHSSSSSSSS